MHASRPPLRRASTALAAAIAVAALLSACASGPSTGPMGFFVTSTGPGKGADLGGLAGADAHCKRLAGATGAGSRNWRAYLSTSAVGNDQPAVHARDRIGKGPWFNAKGVLIARDVAQLHGDNGITKASALDGAAIRSRAAATRPTSTTS